MNNIPAIEVFLYSEAMECGSLNEYKKAIKLIPKKLIK